MHRRPRLACNICLDLLLAAVTRDTRTGSLIRNAVVSWGTVEKGTRYTEDLQHINNRYSLRPHPNTAQDTVPQEMRR
ncbi:hypothetical protein B0H13DRAFT_2026533 [Mycena leptocephala]|nr:hypothetical protein B0H13DRAFT_2026533 [Mycena leptocephala]